MDGHNSDRVDNHIRIDRWERLKEKFEDHEKVHTECEKTALEKDKVWQTKHDALQQAYDLSTAALNIRLEAMNEFRNAMKDQSALYATKSELAFVQKVIWMGLGALLVIEFVLRISWGK